MTVACLADPDLSAASGTLASGAGRLGGMTDPGRGSTVTIPTGNDHPLERALEDAVREAASRFEKLKRQHEHEAEELKVIAFTGYELNPADYALDLTRHATALVLQTARDLDAILRTNSKPWVQVAAVILLEVLARDHEDVEPTVRRLVDERVLEARAQAWLSEASAAPDRPAKTKLRTAGLQLAKGLWFREDPNGYRVAFAPGAKTKTERTAAPPAHADRPTRPVAPAPREPRGKALRLALDVLRRANGKHVDEKALGGEFVSAGLSASSVRTTIRKLRMRWGWPIEGDDDDVRGWRLPM